jgi:hypothetical protein
LHLWPDREADGSIETVTPSKVKNKDDNDMNKLEKVNIFGEGEGERVISSIL